MRIAIAGASGFVGTHLCQALSNSGAQIVALSRSRPAHLPAGVVWRETDLFSAGSTRAALEGADVAVYLIHSMLPSSTLFQGDFHDTDLLLADNFSRGCRSNGVRRIVYLGGLVPEGQISMHLESRREVEGVLKSSGVPLTVLRAGMIVGPGGSSFEILKTLVERLPAMILPQWTQSRTQAVFIDDVVNVLKAAVRDERFSGKTLDLVNGESLNYETLLRQMAEALGVHRTMVHVPIASTGFSKLWVSLFGCSNYELVSPLVDSLLCDLPASEPDLLIRELIQYPSFRLMVREALGRSVSRAPAQPRRRARTGRTGRKTVRSIQRLPRLENRDCHWISTEYMRWLPDSFLSLIRVESDKRTGCVKFQLRGVPLPLLELQLVKGDPSQEREKFHIVGGLLTATTDTGWLEFRQIEGGKYTLSAIHEFVPRLPWPIYRTTQALVHAWTMRRFGEHLARAQTRDVS